MCVSRYLARNGRGGGVLHSLHSVEDDRFSQNSLLSAHTQSRVVWWCHTMNVYICVYKIQVRGRTHALPPSDSSVNVRPPNRNNGRVVATAKHVDIELKKEEIDQ